MPETYSSDKYGSLTFEEVKSLENSYLFPTYQRYELCASHGEGACLFDITGRRYLDFLGGIAVNSLGYGHPRIVKVLREHGERLIHTSNLLYHRYQGLLARRLAEVSGMSRAFFTNSGAEAMEAALKIARAYVRVTGNKEKTRFLCLKNSFHGRTFGALSITSQEKYQAPFRPLLADVQVIGDLTSAGIDAAFDDRVCAVIFEPVQGEAGIRPIPVEFMRKARELCDRHGALLVLDEIQSGFARTGKMFAYQHYDVRPDLVTCAKAIASGYPLGAVLGNSKVAASLKTGEHGTTFGGGPLACRIALEVLDTIEEEGLAQRAAELGSYLMELLRKLKLRHSIMSEVRGVGLMIGVELGPVAPEVVRRMLKRGVIANAAHGQVLRLVPPLIITRNQIDEFVQSLHLVLEEIESEKA